MNIPKSELDEVTRSILAHPEYLMPTYVIDKYKKNGAKTIPSPFSTSIATSIRQALLTETPFSVIRIGDGEVNLLSYGDYPKTGCLNHCAIKQIISMQGDRFNINPLWMIVLRDLMMGALIQADIIGVVGLWRFPPPPKAEDIVQNILRDPRGVSGNWRAVDFMLKLAHRSIFKAKILASAHLYFSILENLHNILPFAKKVFILSNRTKIIDKLVLKYPNINFKYISVGSSEILSSDQPDFLLSIYSTLPVDMVGSLSLVGAGPWAEIYTTWIKQKGGVAVDIGSGFDLMEGELTRPVHKRLSLDKIQQYTSSESNL